MASEQPISLSERQEQCKPVVLVVDDDLTHQKLLGLLSDRLGITCYMCSSCAEALDALRMFSFDVILMDYRMPEVDGCICSERIREMKEEIRGNIPIIAVTAHIMPGSKEKCLAAGMNDFLGKPFTLEELEAKLCFWLERKTESKG
ncbi:hypothetical protein BH11CYA1_BH11CYA1_41310 [soil metagenome]